MSHRVVLSLWNFGSGITPSIVGAEFFDLERSMLTTPRFSSCLLFIVLCLHGCSDTRRDPCQLLTVQDVKSLDRTVTDSQWAGRDGERKEDEVCAFYTDDGDPRAMLFVWYDKEKDPVVLAEMAAADMNGQVVEVSNVGLKAAAYFQGEELEFLAAKSTQGVIGLRTKESVKRDSTEQDQLVLLAEKALSRLQ